MQWFPFFWSFGQLGLPDSIFYFFEKLPINTRKGFARLIAKTLSRLSFVGVLVMFGIGWFTAMQEGFESIRSLIWLVMALLIFELPTIPLPNVLIFTKHQGVKGFSGIETTCGSSAFSLSLRSSLFTTFLIPMYMSVPCPCGSVSSLVMKFCDHSYRLLTRTRRVSGCGLFVFAIG